MSTLTGSHPALQLGKVQIHIDSGKLIPKTEKTREKKVLHILLTVRITFNGVSLLFKAGEIAFDNVRVTRIFNLITLPHSERYGKVIVKWDKREHIEKKRKAQNC